MEEFLIVDGYNIIGALKSSQTEEISLEESRQWLVDKLANYQGYTGVVVYVVFDAHLAPGPGQQMKERGVQVIYTKERETADERIERLVRELRKEGRRIMVATSDHTEQRVIFGEGALRQSARELLQALEAVEKKINQKIESQYRNKGMGPLPLREDIAELFEKWRRGR